MMNPKAETIALIDQIIEENETIAERLERLGEVPNDVGAIVGFNKL